MEAVRFRFVKTIDRPSKACCCCQATFAPAKGIADARHCQVRRAAVNPSDELLRFIRSSFRSVWALELLLALKREQRVWTAAELVSSLRASELVVSKGLDALVAAGLASVTEDGAKYMPINPAVAECVDQLERLYAARPDAVRRAIVSASASGATAFADAFKLRRDD
jgi:hypothetical protein